jgi:type VI secretion system protein ImpG
MAKDLLYYYNQELIYLRQLGAKFGEKHPKIASRLRINPHNHESADPHVTRLVEGVAFLNARVRQKLDDDFPELTDGLLKLLYPHYQTLIPSMAIAQFKPNTELSAAYFIAKGTLLESEPIQDESCRFSTCYPVTLWPIAITAAYYSSNIATAAPQLPKVQSAAVLRLALQTSKPNLSFAELAPQQLRFAIQGISQLSHLLYEMLFRNTVQIALAQSPQDPHPILLTPQSLLQVGFAAEEGLLPYSARSFLGLRLLTELFVFPEKYLFFDLTQLDQKHLVKFNNHLEIYFYFNKSETLLERNITQHNFALGCTPVINLFQQQAEPIRLTHTETEQRIVADVRKPHALEIYDVTKVKAITSEGQQLDYLPLFGLKHTTDTATRFWQTLTRPASEVVSNTDQGSETFLLLTDHELTPTTATDTIIAVQTLCTNRELPQNLIFGNKETDLYFADGSSTLQIKCLSQPTKIIRPILGDKSHWRLLSHLGLNLSSLLENQPNPSALQEILRLYDFQNSAETQALIASIISVTCRPTSARVISDGRNIVCQGLEIHLQLDESQFKGNSLFLFTSTLEHFFSMYCSINSFTKLIVTYKDRPGVFFEWPARIGEITTL